MCWSLCRANRNNSWAIFFCLNSTSSELGFCVGSPRACTALPTNRPQHAHNLWACPNRVVGEICRLTGPPNCTAPPFCFGCVGCVCVLTRVFALARNLSDLRGNRIVMVDWLIDVVAAQTLGIFLTPRRNTRYDFCSLLAALALAAQSLMKVMQDRRLASASNSSSDNTCCELLTASSESSLALPLSWIETSVL